MRFKIIMVSVLLSMGLASCSSGPKEKDCVTEYNKSIEVYSAEKQKEGGEKAAYTKYRQAMEANVSVCKKAVDKHPDASGDRVRTVLASLYFHAAEMKKFEAVYAKITQEASKKKLLPALQSACEEMRKFGNETEATQETVCQRSRALTPLNEPHL
jgi:hypothetical protein